MSWIRWSGLILFAAIATIVVALWLIALPWLIEWGIESGGEKVFGARVEVEDVDLSFNPFGFSVLGLQVANKDEPMKNLFSIRNAQAQTELIPLFLQKVVISDLRIQGLKLDEARSESGALVKQKTSSRDSTKSTPGEKSGLASFSQELPDVEQILEREPLKTIELGKAFEADYRNTRDQIEKTVDALPDEKALKRYEKEIKSLTEGKIKSLEDFQERKARLDTLKKELRAEKEKFETARDTVQDGVGSLRSGFQALQNAPEQDLENLRQRYSLDGVGAVNLLALVAGGEAGDFARRALKYYLLLDEFLAEEGSNEPSAQNEDNETALVRQRAQGRYIHFDSARPLPDFWIQALHLDYEKAAAEDSGNGLSIVLQATDITRQPELLNTPLRFKASSKDGPGTGAVTVNVNGTIDRRSETSKDLFELKLSQLPIQDLDLGSSAVKMTSAMTQVVAQAEVLDRMLDLESDISVRNAQFSSSKRGELEDSLLNILNGLEQFNIQLLARGPVEQPGLDLNSDLDRRLKNAFSSEVSAKMKEFERELKGRLQDKIGDYAGDYSDYLGELSLTEKGLDDQTEMLDKLVEQQLDSYKDAAKEKAKSKVEDALKDKLKNLF